MINMICIISPILLKVLKMNLVPYKKIYIYIIEYLDSVLIEDIQAN